MKQKYEDAMAYLRTLANFGGTLEQAKELAQKAVKIHSTPAKEMSWPSDFVNKHGKYADD